MKFEDQTTKNSLAHVFSNLSGGFWIARDIATGNGTKEPGFLVDKCLTWTSSIHGNDRSTEVHGLNWHNAKMLEGRGVN